MLYRINRALTNIISYPSLKRVRLNQPSKVAIQKQVCWGNSNGNSNNKNRNTKTRNEGSHPAGKFLNLDQILEL